MNAAIPFPDIMRPGGNRAFLPWVPDTKAGRHELLERLTFPYGFWDLPDGRAVVFARTYDPIFVVWPHGRVLPAVGGWVRDAIDPARYFFQEGAPWYSTRDHARIHGLFLALNRAAAATGYGQPPPRPDLLDWLREQALEPVTLPAAVGRRAA